MCSFPVPSVLPVVWVLHFAGNRERCQQQVTFGAQPKRLRSKSARVYNSHSESLSHRTHQERHEVYVQAVFPQRQYLGFRRQSRQPAHPSRNRHQRSRHHCAPSPDGSFIVRYSTAHLALNPLPHQPPSSGAQQQLHEVKSAPSRRTLRLTTHRRRTSFTP